MPTPDSIGDADPFSVLGVTHDCTLEALHLAYRTLARRYHPDVNADPSAAAHMRTINAAFVAARRELLSRGQTSSWHRSGSVSPEPPTPAASEPTARQAPAKEPWTTSSQTNSPTEARDRWAQVVGPAAAIHLRAINLAQRWSRLRSASSSITYAPPTGTHVRRTWIVKSFIGISALLSLAVLLPRLVTVTPVASPTHKSTPLTLTPDMTLSIPWPGLGHVELRDHKIAVAPTGPVSRDSPITWSADGKYLAITTSASLSGSATASVIVVRAQDAYQVSTIPGIAAQWSPRADQLAVLAPTSVSTAPQLELLGIADLLDGHGALSAHVIAPSAGQYLTWSPSGEMIAFSAQGQREINLFNLMTESVSTVLREPPGTIIKPKLWLDDHTILSIQVTSRGGSLEAVDTLAHDLHTLASDVNPKSPLAWNPARGQLLYAANTSGRSTDTAYLRGEVSQPPIAVPSNLPTELLGGWSPDGQWLSFAGPTHPASRNVICLARAPMTLPVASWDTTCLLVPGTLLGLTWETSGARLNYVRQVVGQAATEELREVDVRIVS